MTQPPSDAKPAQSYHLTLFREDRTMTPVGRTVVRDSATDAVDSARRWLRLVRHANPDLPRAPDRWSVAIALDNRLPKIIASGSVGD